MRRIGGFHGYADPSERKDPNSGSTYHAYSWAHTLTGGTHVVDLHLARSIDDGSTFTYVQPLYQCDQAALVRLDPQGLACADPGERNGKKVDGLSRAVALMLE